MNEIARLQHDIERHIAICGDLATENEKLQAALEKIADPSTSWGHMKLIARDALAKEGK